MWTDCATLAHCAQAAKKKLVEFRKSEEMVKVKAARAAKAAKNEAYAALYACGEMVAKKHDQHVVCPSSNDPHPIIAHTSPNPPLNITASGRTGHDVRLCGVRAARGRHGRAQVVGEYGNALFRRQCLVPQARVQQWQTPAAVSGPPRGELACRLDSLLI